MGRTASTNRGRRLTPRRSSPPKVARHWAVGASPTSASAELPRADQARNSQKSRSSSIALRRRRLGGCSSWSIRCHKPNSPSTQLAEGASTTAHDFGIVVGRAAALGHLAILSSNCAALQAELDRATESNTGAELGSVSYQSTLGYMAAAEDQLKAAACID
jgi:hypothetical protein